MNLEQRQFLLDLSGATLLLGTLCSVAMVAFRVAVVMGIGGFSPEDASNAQQVARGVFKWSVRLSILAAIAHYAALGAQ